MAAIIVDAELHSLDLLLRQSLELLGCCSCCWSWCLNIHCGLCYCFWFDRLQGTFRLMFLFSPAEAHKLFLSNLCNRPLATC